MLPTSLFEEMRLDLGFLKWKRWEDVGVWGDGKGGLIGVRVMRGMGM